MKTLFNQPASNLLKSCNFEVLNEKEMGQLKGGDVLPRGKDVFDPDEH